MADDKLNEGSEEENKSNQSDEDFGLPDLEFDELQELDFNLDDSAEEETESEETTLPEPEGIDMSVLDDIDVPESSDDSPGLQPGDLDPPEGSVLDEGIEEVEDVLDSAQLISDRLGDDEEDPLSPDFSADINYDDLMGGDDSADTPEEEASSIEDMGLDLVADDSEDSDDLLANIDSPDQLAALGILDEEESSESSESSDTEESSYDDFGTESAGSSLFAADSAEEEGSIFATDSMSFEDEKPEFEEADTPSLPPNYKPYSYEESSGGFAKVIIIGVLIISVIGGAFYYFSLDDGPKAVAKKEVPKKRVKKPAAKKPAPKEEAAASTETAAESKPKAATEKPVVSKPKPQAASAQPGEIIRVTERSSRSYVIIGSFIDEDLALDYASKLSSEGNGVKIIHPYGKSKRYRVSIADFSSYGDAASQLGGFKGQYGDEVWALQY